MSGKGMKVIMACVKESNVKIYTIEIMDTCDK